MKIKKELLIQQKEHDRKARTHRLIERGALLESLIKNAETMNNEEIKEILQIALLPPITSQNQSKPPQKPNGDNSLE